MGVRDCRVERGAKLALKTIPLPFDDVGAGLSDALRGSFKPGFPFEVVDIQHFVRDVTAVFDYDVKIGTDTTLTDLVADPAVADAGNTGNGSVATIVPHAGATPQTITLTAAIDGQVSHMAAAVPDGGNTGTGTVDDLLGGLGCPTETWTLTCLADATKFSVVGSVSGATVADAVVGTPFDGGYLSFTLNQGGVPFVTGDVFTIAATNPAGHFTVEGDESGALGVAEVDTAFSCSQCEFEIDAGVIDFEAGDIFTFAIRRGVAPVDATAGSATLGTWDERTGGVAEEINLHLTTGAAGAAQEGTVFVTLRPLGLEA